MIAGMPQEQKAELPLTTSNGTYVYDKAAKTITVTDENSEQTVMEIIEHTASKMVLKSSFESTSVEMGVTSTSSGDLILTLSK